MFEAKQVGDWDVLMRVLQNLSNSSLNREVTSSTVMAGGKFLVKAYRGTIDTGMGSWPPLSRMTIERKGSAKPLLHKGYFRSAIRTHKRGVNVSVGIREGAITPDGERLDVIAMVQEFGATIPVTKKMRNWFAAQGFPLRASTNVIVVPRRALFKPVYEQYQPELKQAFAIGGWKKILEYFYGSKTLRIID
jgi:hypothetical protein